MIQTWQITQTQNISINWEATSLDSFTRQLPDGYYSTFRTFDKCRRVLGLKSHLRRLFDPVTAPDITASELRRGLRSLLKPFRPDEARVRVVMTKQGQVYVAIEPLKSLPPIVYKNGVLVETTEIQRHSPRLKSTAFIGESETERRHIAQEGIFEALILKNGRILEGMTSNFFYTLRPEWSKAQTTLAPDAHLPRTQVQFAKQIGSAGEGEILFTAQRDILLGVTRKTIIHLARGRGLEMRYRALKLNQLSTVDEAFITSSSRGVVPIIQIDDVTIGQGRPGPITQTLISAYDDYVLKHAEKI